VTHRWARGSRGISGRTRPWRHGPPPGLEGKAACDGGGGVRRRRRGPGRPQGPVGGVVGNAGRGRRGLGGVCRVTARWRDSARCQYRGRAGSTPRDPWAGGRRGPGGGCGLADPLPCEAHRWMRRHPPGPGARPGGRAPPLPHPWATRRRRRGREAAPPWRPVRGAARREGRLLGGGGRGLGRPLFPRHHCRQEG